LKRQLLKNGRFETETKTCSKIFDNDHKLLLDSNALKFIDNSREHIETKVTTKFKDGIANVYKFERELDDLHREVKHLRKEMNNEARSMHDRIFENYNQVFNTHPGVLIDNFLNDT